jgi:hypothetical protein
VLDLSLFKNRRLICGLCSGIEVMVVLDALLNLSLLRICLHLYIPHPPPPSSQHKYAPSIQITLSQTRTSILSCKTSIRFPTSTKSPSIISSFSVHFPLPARSSHHCECSEYPDMKGPKHNRSQQALAAPIKPRATFHSVQKYQIQHCRVVVFPAVNANPEAVIENSSCIKSLSHTLELVSTPRPIPIPKPHLPSSYHFATHLACRDLLILRNF